MDAPRKPLKEKVVLYYELLLRTGKVESENPAFWDEFFLLWAKCDQLEQILGDISKEQLLEKKSLINNFFYHCVNTVCEDAGIRAVNALRTATSIVKGIVKQAGHSFGFDLIDLLVGFDRAEFLIQKLIERLNVLLCGDHPAVLKTLSLYLLLVLSASADNVSQNTLLEYLMINSLFESIIQILANPAVRNVHGYDAVLLLTLLVNYRKHEAVNPYIVKLSIVDDDLALHGYCHVIGQSLNEFNGKFQELLKSSQSTGLFASFTNAVAGMLVPEEAASQLLKTDESMLLAMYEAVHLNRNFISTLTNIPTDSTSTSICESPSATSEDEGRGFGDETNGDAVPAVKPAVSSTHDESTYSSSLLVAFLTYCSVVMQDVKCARNQNGARLSMIILTCIVEDQYANSLMHDQQLSFRVPLYRAPMRHRKAGFDRRPPSRPLVCAVLDLCAEFMLSHMMRALPYDLYTRSLGIVHRILCYERKCKVRVSYAWRDLWNALATLLKFLIVNEDELMRQFDLFTLIDQIVVIFNLFITYGDTFLPNPSSYDELYYELIRHSETFESLHSMSLRFAANENAYRTVATKLCNHLSNIRAITTHFQAKLTAVSDGGIATLSEAQILEVVRSHYDTLTLKLQENLDVFERYNEKPRESAFFVQLVKAIVVEARAKLAVSAVADQQSVLRELSTIG